MLKFYLETAFGLQKEIERGMSSKLLPLRAGSDEAQNFLKEINYPYIVGDLEDVRDDEVTFYKRDDDYQLFGDIKIKTYGDKDQFFAPSYLAEIDKEEVKEYKKVSNIKPQIELAFTSKSGGFTDTDKNQKGSKNQIISYLKTTVYLYTRENDKIIFFYEPIKDFENKKIDHDFIEIKLKDEKDTRLTMNVNQNFFVVSFLKNDVEQDAESFYTAEEAEDYINKIIKKNPEFKKHTKKLEEIKKIFRKRKRLNNIRSNMYSLMLKQVFKVNPKKLDSYNYFLITKKDIDRLIK